jgi:hypothetical protein
MNLKKPKKCIYNDLENEKKYIIFPVTKFLIYVIYLLINEAPQVLNKMVSNNNNNR